LIKFKSHLYYEEKDGLQENLKALKKCPGSKITFFKNGKSLGVAFEDIFSGDYFPGVGLFKGAHVKFNHGPKFKYPPQVCDQQQIGKQTNLNSITRAKARLS
jgi:Set1/Ash2 histone methyltransferase complex subunit ASH2